LPIDRTGAYEGNCTSSSGSVCTVFVSSEAGRSTGAGAGARRGALGRAARFAERFAARLTGRFPPPRFALRRAAPAFRAALFFFDRPDIIFLLDLRDFTALLVLFRRFLAMRVPPENGRAYSNLIIFTFAC
jgi:hypothetical protein